MQNLRILTINNNKFDLKEGITMGEPVFVGPDSPNDVKKIDIEKLKVAILKKWKHTDIKTVNVGNISVSWLTRVADWYNECALIDGVTLSIQSNDPNVVSETVIWFYNISPNKDLYLYTANTIANLYQLTANTSEQSVLNWLSTT